MRSGKDQAMLANKADSPVTDVERAAADMRSAGVGSVLSKIN